MRRGLMLWREDELSQADVRARQARLQQAMRSAGLDALLVYTNHVRSAGVTYLTGFTPYWSDALLLVLPEGCPLFATALSKRVGEWIRSVNPTAEIAHSPLPGRLVGERLASAGAARVGVVELDRLPGGLAEEIMSSAPGVELHDVSDIFAAVRGEADAAELRLVRTADRIAGEAFTAGDPDVARAGDFTGPVERAARLAGAEECYVAVAPDLSHDSRLFRTGDHALGRTFAVRLSIAYNGVWIRRIETFSREPAIRARIADVGLRLDRLSAELDLKHQLGPQLAQTGVADWHLEVPFGTRPLKTVAGSDRELAVPAAYGVLTAAFGVDGDIILGARPVGLGDAGEAA